MEENTGTPESCGSRGPSWGGQCGAQEVVEAGGVGVGVGASELWGGKGSVGSWRFYQVPAFIIVNMKC